MEYVVKVTSVTTIRVEADSEDEAVEKAGEIAWEFDADEINCEIISE